MQGKPRGFEPMTYTTPPPAAAAAAAAALIPGLPDDVAALCLLHLPYSTLAMARAVCRRWRLYLSDEASCLDARRRLGLTRPWLLVFASHHVTGHVQWQACELARIAADRDGGLPPRSRWRILPPMPTAAAPSAAAGRRDRICPPGFGCVPDPHHPAVFICGGIRSSGMELSYRPMDTFLKFDLFANAWTTLGPMSTPRSFFASGMIGGRIYVAGGDSPAASHGRRFGTSAEVYDPAAGAWRPVASMRAHMARYDSAVLNGKLHITEGWAWPFLASPRGEVYDPETDTWESMRAGMREGWTGLSVVHGGRLYVISEHDNSTLKAFDEESDSWRHVGGAAMPSHMELPICVNAVPGHTLVVVAKNLHIALGTLSRSSGPADGHVAHTVEWRSVLAPAEFRDFHPSHAVILHV